MEQLNHYIETLNGILFSPYTVYALLFTGVLFTVWSGFGQFRALTHGISVVRGKYDDKNDPGAINHFQALSAALSATVGLGNIAGVALAVALGGPGAIFWMWVIGILGMSLKLTEVTQSMLYRNTDDPNNPHGGPMFVVKKGFAKWGMAPIGSAIGGIFVITLLISALTGGNMFQAWNVADITNTYFEVPHVATGVILSIVVGLVIIGGIKRIGSVAGKIVPIMCTLYLLAAGYVLVQNFGEIPAMITLIVKSGLGIESPSPVGAFMGGTFGYAAMWGVKRALFSSEAGQGSSPIAHSAAKTDEPVREGVVAGLEPFIDTIVVCTITSLVILSSGIWNRGPDVPADLTAMAFVAAVDDEGAQQTDAGDPSLLGWTIAQTPLSNTEGGINGVFTIYNGSENEQTANNLNKLHGSISKVEASDGSDAATSYLVDWDTVYTAEAPTPSSEGYFFDYKGASLTGKAFDMTTPGLGKWLITLAVWLFAISTMISWSYYGEQGIYYLFGWLGDKKAGSVVLFYKFLYCALILMTCIAAAPLLTDASGRKVALIGTDTELDMWTTLGLGVMLVANIPIMLIFGAQAMKAYHAYFKKMKAGGDPPHDAPPFSEVVEGKDVE
ncbi:MAG: AGCS family alanine or glycine:cation symporter [Phycisphaerales bacterium]|jgi:AGCS family alanine or glycine:cation symporter